MPPCLIFSSSGNGAWGLCILDKPSIHWSIYLPFHASSIKAAQPLAFYYSSTEGSLPRNFLSDSLCPDGYYCEPGTHPAPSHGLRLVISLLECLTARSGGPVPPGSHVLDGETKEDSGHGFYICDKTLNKSNSARLHFNLIKPLRPHSRNSGRTGIWRQKLK